MIGDVVIKRLSMGSAVGEEVQWINPPPEHTNTLKGTVRPNLISLRVVSLNRPWFGHPPLYVLTFIILILIF
jgi:hypothetical protein